MDKKYILIFTLILLLTSCNTGIQVQMEEPEPTVSEEIIESKVDSRFIKSVRKSYHYDSYNDMPDTFNFAIKMDVKEQELEFINILMEDEDTMDVIKLYQESCEIEVSIENINDNYLKWLETNEKDTYNNIIRNNYYRKVVYIVSNQEMDSSTNMYYGTALVDDKDTYHGDNSVYAYEKGDVLNVTKLLNVDANTNEAVEHSTSVTLDEVTYERPWYMDYCRDVDTIELSMGWDEFCNVSQASLEPTVDGFMPYNYTIKAKEGKGKELREKVKELFGEHVWVNEDGFFN